MRWVGIVALVLTLPAAALAGEIVFVNGSRLPAELSNDLLVISTGSDLIEVASEHVVLLSRDEIRLRDGRVLHGTLVGGHLKARTALGELTVTLDELRVFRADGAAAPARVTSTTVPAASETGVPDGDSALRPNSAPVAASKNAGPLLSTPSSGTPTAGPEPAPVTTPPKPQPVEVRLGPVPTPPLPPGRRLEVVAAASGLYRDAVATAEHVGRVVQGEIVTYLDFIDRRLRILNRVIFDGGYWIKVRTPEGTVGWLPAETVQEAR